MTVEFKTAHDKAFVQLGARAAGQQWSAFDVTLEEARQGNAGILVTTIWNFHSVRDEHGKRKPTVVAVCEDHVDGTLWYRSERPEPNTTRTTWIAHCRRLDLALEHNVPIVGVLKDVQSGRCSLDHVFDCVKAVPSLDEKALWLQLVPRHEAWCETRQIDIRALVSDFGDVLTVRKASSAFESDIRMS
ncbi:hypothetical protein [Paraburkholderia fynbosensis]|uniref:Uncharacterized protein n=1 Tax=Paraburkholderia fynbosensis TaxID=1200993 RepID=A0A6J5FPP1_9BURK|nr:hypothetical protein [Paraburkholderia fynbosensis]CAB3782005.1 hypothetical protein LMG27177_01142 [Paraburkholderia fynbosensis]